MRGHDLRLVLFNAEPGDWVQGERGLACLPGREDAFRRTIAEALTRADRLGCPQIHVMAGLCPHDERTRHRAAMQRYESRLAWAAGEARAAGKTLLIEPINPRDMPGYLLTRQAQAHELVARIDSPHLKVQMDLYHCQITEGDVSMRLRQWLPTGQVGHVQIAAVPDRGEPDQGELHYPHVLEQLASLGYAGWVGCEYRPRGVSIPTGPSATTAGLGWLARYR